MAFVAVKPFELFPSALLSGSRQNFTLDAAGEKMAFVFRAAKTGNVTHIVFRVDSSTNAQPIAVALQTVDGTTGAPSGTNAGGSAAGTLASPSVATHEVALGTAAAVTLGDELAVVLGSFTGTAGNIQVSAQTSAATTNYPYMSHFTSAWAKGTALPMFSLKYDDGSYSSPHSVPAGARGNTAFTSASSPDEYGVKFKVPYGAKCSGARFYGSATVATTSTFALKLYDADASTVMASQPFDPEVLASNVNETLFTAVWAEQTLVADTFYRIAVEATGAGSVRAMWLDVANALQLNESGAVTVAHGTSRTNAGTWTDVDTRLQFVYPIISAIETTTGGGGSSEHSYGSIF